MKRTIILAAILTLAAQLQAQAQTITGAGTGIAANSIYYNISMVAVDRFDGDRNPTINISLNGKLWPILPPSPYSSAYCQVTQWDSAQAKPVQVGFIKATGTAPDGTSEVLGGTIWVNLKALKVIGFKAVAFAKKNPMPLVVKAGIIQVLIRDPITNLFVAHPERNFFLPMVQGTMWMERDGTMHSAIFDTMDAAAPISQLQIIPPPGGPGGHGTNGIYPLNIM